MINIKGSINLLEKGFEIVASTGDVDRMGDTINPNGWFLTNYKKNPVMLWGHDNSIPPVGRAEKIWIEEGKLKIVAEFAPTPFAQELEMLVRKGFLNTVSVGFLPLIYDEKGMIEIEGKMYRRMTDEEVKKGMYDNDWGMKFDKQELLEVSWVGVPALPQALVQSRELGLSLMTKQLEDIDNQSKVARIKQMEKSIDSMKEAITRLEEHLKGNLAKSCTSKESKKVESSRKLEKAISPELQFSRIAIKALEQIIINQKAKANENKRIGK